MRTVILAVASVGLAANCLAHVASHQTDNRGPVKLPIHHADPWAVKRLLEGGQLSSPEISTIAKVLGGGSGSSQGQNTGTSPFLKDGYLIVNPTDNSLWWYPKRS